MLKILNLQEFENGCREWLKKATAYTERVYKGFVIESAYWVIDETPQWSGNAAANWYLGVGQPTYQVNTELLAEAYADGWVTTNSGVSLPDAKVHMKGDEPAVSFSMEHILNELPKLRLPVVAYLCNTAMNLMEEVYIQKLEAGENDFLRPVNRPGHMVERRVQMVTPGKLVDAKFLSMLVP